MAAAPAGTSTPPSQMRGRLVWAGAAVAVAVIAVVAAVVLVRPAPAKTTIVTDFISEKTAAGQAATVTAEVSGGPWNLSEAWGYVGGPTLNLSAQLPPAILGCAIHNGTTTGTSTPASTPGYYLGLGTVWILEYLNESDNATLEVVVHNQTAGEIAEWSGARCEPDPLLGSGLIDSSVAAAAVNATASGAAWIKLNTAAAAEYSLEETVYHPGGARALGAIWTVSYTSSESSFGAEVFANNGTIVCISIFGC